jgi:hypothetical protein
MDQKRNHPNHPGGQVVRSKKRQQDQRLATPLTTLTTYPLNKEQEDICNRKKGVGGIGGNNRKKVVAVVMVVRS